MTDSPLPSHSRPRHNRWLMLIAAFKVAQARSLSPSAWVR